MSMLKKDPILVKTIMYFCSPYFFYCSSLMGDFTSDYKVDRKFLLGETLELLLTAEFPDNLAAMNYFTEAKKRKMSLT